MNKEQEKSSQPATREAIETILDKYYKARYAEDTGTIPKDISILPMFDTEWAMSEILDLFPQLELKLLSDDEIKVGASVHKAYSNHVIAGDKSPRIFNSIISNQSEISYRAGAQAQLDADNRVLRGE